MRLVSIHLLTTAFFQVALAVSAPAASQSPIDFNSASTTYAVLPPLSYNYSAAASLNVINNGAPDEESTIKAILGTADSSLSILGRSYTFTQFHFHTESEHRLNGVSFPMELHMVHQKTTDAASLLVTGRWIVEGAENAALAGIFSNFPTDAAGYNLSGFDLNALLPSGLESYRYSGSLTTPDFTEPVEWIFLSTPLEMSAAQIQAFKTLFPSGNARDVQPLEGRTIYTDVVPEPGIAGLCAAGGILLLSRSRRRR